MYCTILESFSTPTIVVDSMYTKPTRFPFQGIDSTAALLSAVSRPPENSPPCSNLIIIIFIRKTSLHANIHNIISTNHSCIAGAWKISVRWKFLSEFSSMMILWALYREWSWFSYDGGLMKLVWRLKLKFTQTFMLSLMMLAAEIIVWKCLESHSELERCEKDEKKRRFLFFDENRSNKQQLSWAQSGF